MTPHHINSKQQMLSNHDIMLVAAHDHPETAAKHYKDAGSPKQVNPVMLQYAIFNKMFSMPTAIRLREGNTLFAIYPAQHGAMFMMFDADSPNNTINNITTACEAARKMGFKKLIAPTNNDVVRKMAKRAFDKHHKNGDKFSVKGDLVTLELAHG